MDNILARKMWATLEPYHAMIHFAPEAFAEWEGLGFPHRGMGYFASRAAPMGAVNASVVTSTFYNFNPETVARFIPSAWEIAPPGRVLEARERAVDAALRRLLGDWDSEKMTWAADTARRATEACRPEGRPLFAGHTEIDPPDEPHLRLWHAVTLLREYRGDGHIHALVAAGLSGIEAVRSYSATGEMFNPEWYRRSRGWRNEAWQEAEESLLTKGWLDAQGELTETGREGREAIEAETDRLAMDPWKAIGQEDADRLRATVRSWSRAIVAAGGVG